MCIGIPMQVVEVEPGHALCAGRGERRRVRTALVGAAAPGDWLLVFLDSAVEVLDAGRAREIDATLDLVEGLAAQAPAPFELPSRTSRAALLELTGAATD